MKNVNRALMVAAAAGTCVSAAVAQTGLVNISGASLLENYVKSNASTNDFIDADGNGVSGYLRSGIQQLAPGGPSNLTQPWAVQYRVTGSVNGFIELTLNGFGRAATGDDTTASPAGIRGARPNGNPPVADGRASTAYHNRVLYINANNASGVPAIYNAGNPGGAPNTGNGLFRSVYSSPPNGSGGSITIDITPLDVSTSLAVRKAGTPAWNRRPAQPGYGQNAVNSGTRPFGTAGFGNLPSFLADLNGRNLFDPNNPNAADSNTIFDNKLAFAPIAPVINFGTGIRRVTMTQLQHLFITGRAATGENFVVLTRDVGSGTRNAFSNGIGVDPSFANGDNVGGLSTSSTDHVMGASYTPSNKGSNGGMEQALRNTRLGIGYIGTERGVTGSGTGSWLAGGALEIADVLNDLYGGTQYVRPTTTNLVHNSPNGWVLGGQSVLATIGDPRSNAANLGGQGWAGAFDPFVDTNCDGIRQSDEPFTDLNGNGQYDAFNAEAGLSPRLTPPMANPYAAAYLNNITRSIAATTSVPNDPANFGMPGEYAADQFILLAAVDRLHSEADYTQMSANPGFNNCVQNYTLSFNVHNNSAYLAFNESQCGKNPARATGVVYSDGVSGGSNFLTQAGTSASYGANLACRNKISGDFNGSGARDAGDVVEMVKAWRQRNGGPAWTAPDGVYGSGAGQQAVIEILGDFDGNGSFNRTDVRYYADGLYLTNGRLDRAGGFAAVDSAFESLTGNNNFFGTVIATGKPYFTGDSAADLAGSATGPRKGYAPYGADGRVDAADIDYLVAQYKNPHILDGAANWSDLSEASYFDLSADLNGDLIVDQRDLCKLVKTILGTSIGDVNLDGVVDAADVSIATANLGTAGGWARGDADGDGQITEADVQIIADASAGLGCICPCKADYNRDGGVDGGDVASFFQDWESSLGCADVNEDGGIDGGDVQAFFLAWEVSDCGY